MNVKKYVFIGIGIFILIALVAVGISAKFSFSNIASNPYMFIENFFSQWSPALSASGTLIVALLAVWAIYETRRRERDRAIHALHDEMHWNMSDVVTLRFQISERLKNLEGSSPVYADCIEKNMPFQPIDTAVFDSMKNSGQLHWLGEMRMDIVVCYKLIRMYNQDAEYKPLHTELLANLWETLGKAIRDLEGSFKFLPRYLKETGTNQKAKSEQEGQRGAKLLHLSREHLLQRYMVSQVPTFFFFGSLSLIAHHLIVQRATAVMSIGEKAQYVLGWLSLPLGIIAILWAIALLTVSLKILSKAKRVESVITGLIEGDNELFYYIATVTVFGISFASVLVLMIQVGMDDLYIYILFGVALLLLMSFVYNIYLSARQRKLPKNSTTQSSEPHNHDA